MKLKNIILSLIIAMGAIALAYSKSADELYSEYGAIMAKSTKSSDTIKERREYVSQNSEDIKAAFGAWLESSKWSKLLISEINGLSQQERDQAYIERTLYGVFYEQNRDLEISADIAIRLNTRVYYENAIVENPSFYKELKAAEWKFGDGKLPMAIILRLASYEKDEDFITSITPKIALQSNGFDIYFCAMKDKLLSMDNLQEAYLKSTEIEDFLMSNLPNSDYLSKIRDIQDTLYLRIVRNQKIKEIYGN